MKDTYNTIIAPTEGVFKEKGSRFLSYLYPVNDEEEIREILQKLKKEHYNARHHCYAWRLGKEDIRFRANDDGEPSSTAGKPILGQLVSHDLTQVLLVVVRYFGGILLGTSGLINAYREASADAIRHAAVETRLVEKEFVINCNYTVLNAVMQILKNENLTQTAIELTEMCRVSFTVRKSETERVLTIFRKLYDLQISPVDK